MSESATITEPATRLTDAQFDQYRAVRNGGAGYREFQGRGLIEVSGSEAVPFLNGIITNNDVKTLEIGHWMLAAFPNVQGRPIALVRVLNRGDNYLFETEAATHGPVFQALHRFTLAGDFKVADRTDSHTLITLQGAGAATIVEKLLNSEAAKVGRHRVAIATGEAGTATVIRASHTAEDGFDLLVERPEAIGIREKLTACGAIALTDAVWEILRIEAGIPRFGIDMTANNVVLETVPEEAVSYTKGCYVGQEIIARIHWRGHVAKKLTGLKLEGPAASEEQLFTSEGKDAGRITSVTYSPSLEQWIALGVVKYDQLTEGTALRIGSAESDRSGSVARLPLVRGSWTNIEPPGGEP